MAIPCSIKDLELKKFKECPDNEVAVGVKICNPGDISGGGGGGGSGPLAGVQWDAHSEQIVGNVVTLRFYEGGLSGTLLKTGVLTYADDCLQDLVSSEWT